MPKSLSEKAWVKQVLKNYYALEKLRPMSFDSAIDDWPEWVIKLWLVLLAVSHPSLKVKNAKQ